MRFALALLLAAGCAKGQPTTPCSAAGEQGAGATCGGNINADDAARDEGEIKALLDDWHEAASVGDAARYFGHFAPGAVFIGTDVSERWTLEEFEAYATPHFEDGHGWTMRAERRSVVVDGSVAWFDEDLTSEGLGPVRGSGVLVRTPGGWAISHYVLSFTIPNERVGQLKALLASPVEQPEGSDEDAGSSAEASQAASGASQ